MTKHIFRLLRPHQYIKNLFVFLPLFFGLKGFDFDLVWELVFVFVGFSFVASSVYIFNDIVDVERDRQHPVKKNRPIASGSVSIRTASITGTVLVALGLYIARLEGVWLLFLCYLLLNVFYSLKLKHVPIVDVLVISMGFVIRLIVGASVASIELSMWIVIMTFLLSLFLALSKRKGDLVNLDGKADARPVLEAYNHEFLTVCMGIMASVVIVAYIMYTTSAEVIARTGSNYVYVTSIFVLFGILRYLKITLFDQTTDSPTKVLIRDIWLQLSIVAWLASFALMLYR